MYGALPSWRHKFITCCCHGPNDTYARKRRFEIQLHQHWGRILLEKLITAQLVKTFVALMVADSLLPCSQELATGPVLCQLNLIHYFIFKIRCNIILSAVLVYHMVLSVHIFRLKFYMHFSSSPFMLSNLPISFLIWSRHNIWWGEGIVLCPRFFKPR
jgi:hypothetical protein